MPAFRMGSSEILVALAGICVVAGQLPEEFARTKKVATIVFFCAQNLHSVHTACYFSFWYCASCDFLGFFFIEGEGKGIDAVAKSCWGGTVGENMAEMS